ncbi:MAG: alpha-glucan phosphorylase [Proteobacteria bacterium]|nr:MAG: alpha-glucan phosphorylase [Pseudomonadota bacterium]
MPITPRGPGSDDVRRATTLLAARIPAPLAPLARLAFNYAWSWARGGPELFASVDADRWSICRRNPVRLLQEVPLATLERAAFDSDLCRRAAAVEERIAAQLAAPPHGGFSPDRPVAFFCAEYGVHPSLPIYSGGLGVLAGDLLKAASDAHLPMVAIGLLYRDGYFRQRIDTSGWQHEYWVSADPERLPLTLVTAGDGQPLRVPVPVRGTEVQTQIWRADVGSVPLYLLDPDRPENRRIDRWIAARLYVGDLDMRLAQYALLGRGGVRALRALGIEPSVLHLNEGHAGLATLELAASEVAAGRALPEALAAVRARTVFTTHTPVAAGNETYAPEAIVAAHPDFAAQLHTDWDSLLRLARDEPDRADCPIGMTQFALRLARSTNAVSRRHGETARAMWQATFRARTPDEVPIGSVTNGVHVATWMAAPMRELLDRHLGEGWEARCDEDATWRAFDAIPDGELWAVRSRLRAQLVEIVRDRATTDRLARGEPRDYVELATRAFDPDHLTLGFARRLATYKRMHLLTRDLGRALQLLGGPRPVQILLAGKAHPQDDEAKRIVQLLFRAKGRPHVGERIAYLHDYDMELALHLVAGCDLWLNMPRPPFEASGTSGMKAALNGGVHMSVLDGWWPEAYDGTNGWAIDGGADADGEALDARHSDAFLGLMEREVTPLFYERDADGIPRGWLQRVRASLRTAARDFSARRMLGDYADRVYRSPSQR